MGRSIAYIRVTCDGGCGAFITVDLNTRDRYRSSGWDESGVENKLKLQKWVIIRDCEYCPDCKGKYVEKEQIEGLKLRNPKSQGNDFPPEITGRGFFD